MIQVTLPLPPSANNLFFTLKNGRGRAKTQPYKDWLRIARGAMLVAYDAAGRPEYGKKDKMALHLRVGTNYTRDLSNTVKPVEDALCAFLPIPDDRYNDRLTIERDLTCEGFVIATLCPADCGQRRENLFTDCGSNVVSGVSP